MISITAVNVKGNTNHQSKCCLKNVNVLYACNHVIVPQILIVHLKRFDRFQRKIRKFVKFEFDYDLSEFCKRKRKGNYSLRALVVHEGYSACSGHYYCYAKAPDDRWYCFNDSHVKCVSEEFLLTLKPYILFYEKI